MEIPTSILEDSPRVGVKLREGNYATLRPRSAYIENARFLDPPGLRCGVGEPGGYSTLGGHSRLRTSTRQQRVARRRAALSLDLNVIFDLIVKGIQGADQGSVSGT